MTLNDSGNAAQGPECIAKTMGTSALAQEVKQGMALRGGEFGLTAGMPFDGEPGLTVLGQRIPPATDRTRRCFHLAGHLAYSPAVLEEGYGHTTTDFQLLFGAYVSHMTLSGTPISFFSGLNGQ